MLEQFRTEERAALRAILAAGLGAAIYYLRNSALIKSALIGGLLELFAFWATYMLIPFVFSSLCLSLVGFLSELAHGVADYSAFTVILYAVAFLSAAYVIYIMQEPPMLAILGACCFVRLVWKR